MRSFFPNPALLKLQLDQAVHLSLEEGLQQARRGIRWAQEGYFIHGAGRAQGWMDLIKFLEGVELAVDVMLAKERA